MKCKTEKDCERMPWCRFAGKCLGPRGDMPSMLDYGEGLPEARQRIYWDELREYFKCRMTK